MASTMTCSGILRELNAVLSRRPRLSSCTALWSPDHRCSSKRGCGLGLNFKQCFEAYVAFEMEGMVQEFQAIKDEMGQLIQCVEAALESNIHGTIGQNSLSEISRRFDTYLAESRQRVKFLTKRKQIICSPVTKALEDFEGQHYNIRTGHFKTISPSDVTHLVILNRVLSLKLDFEVLVDLQAECFRDPLRSLWNNLLKRKLLGLKMFPSKDMLFDIDFRGKLSASHQTSSHFDNVRATTPTTPTSPTALSSRTYRRDSGFTDAWQAKIRRRCSVFG
ncbi:hypothetical protein MPTK1_6g09220 [Marchantia polymorpha subsp. ruderalis]|uniref:Uncharacterized protein n=2 Tax=Marchantia polymorpha TaxID=3197 RepID=A0AAF6BQ59_MARPO|nr:hypothetical protein MARPO_0152s0032 [Marchantia polymorpha]BBN14143.1 hypothetical protein Mp_6g09220 [Marchantia polymorpha subsp. ruderalis]|eukprot:PTQ28919.1 hypothetical protein MARPO_0152s0032 [Marchantia polymorpha]